MEYQVLPATIWQTDLSEMFVLMKLIFVTSQRLLALVAGMDRPIGPVRRANNAPLRVAYSQQHPLAPIPAPMLRLTI